MRKEYIESLFSGFGLKVDVTVCQDCQNCERIWVQPVKGSPYSDYEKVHDVATMLMEDGIFDYVPERKTDCWPWAVCAVNTGESYGF